MNELKAVQGTSDHRPRLHGDCERVFSAEQYRVRPINLLSRRGKVQQLRGKYLLALGA